MKSIFTVRKRSLGQGNMFTGMCLSQGGSTWPGTPRNQVHALGADTPPDQVHPLPSGADTPSGIRQPLGADTPLEAGTPPSPGADNTASPREQTPPWEQTQTPRADIPLWEETPPRADTPPPGAEHAGRYGQHAGGTHPTGMQSC